MASVLKVDKLDPQSGTALEIGTSGDTVTVPSGVGLTLTDSTLLLPTTITSTTEVKTNKVSPATGTAFALGDSGDTFTVPSGATIDNLGTATGIWYDDNQVQSNIAVLGFKVAVNGSLVKYDLVDQAIDEYEDASGVDAGASTNETRDASGKYYSGAGAGTTPTGADSSDTSVSGYTTLVCTSASGSLEVTDGGTVDIMVVAGGGSGGAGYGGGAGAGGLIYKTGHALTTNTYNWVVGAGGTGITVQYTNGNPGSDSTFAIDGGVTEFTAKGGGGGAQQASGAQTGGCGGAAGQQGTGGAATQSSQSGDSGTYGFGYAGGDGTGASNYNSGGGGATGSVGENGSTLKSGDGGTGKDMSAIFGTAVGESGWFGSGGGGGWCADGNNDIGTASIGGGSDGGGNDGTGPGSVAGQANTGGGSGGGSSSVENNGHHTGTGGSGVVLVRYADGAFVAYNNMTLVANDTTALAEPDTSDMVMLMENAAGTATLNTDIKGYISRDSGTTFTAGTLVDEGTWGTNKKILAFHDLDISGQPSGTSMTYKIETLNQSASKITRIYATSIGWR